MNDERVGMFQYVFSGESEWTEQRIKQLQVLKDIALKVIDFISQFEDELVRIRNKPKFVLNSNYVITHDHIVAAARPVRRSASGFDWSLIGATILPNEPGNRVIPNGGSKYGTSFSLVRVAPSKASTFCPRVPS